MQLGYTVLNLALIWVNTYATFKVLSRRSTTRQSTRSSRLQQRNKREMKSCLSVWVVWVCWKYLERVVDATIGMFIPFLHEIKCLFLLLLIITRPWGAEPLVLNVLRPTIRPYTGIIDACLHGLELGGDFFFLLLSLPKHMLVSWWNSDEEESPIDKKINTNEPEEKKKVKVAPPPPFPVPMVPDTSKPDPPTEDSSAATRAAIEAHQKEQEEQALDEERVKEIQARSARDRAAHLRRVAVPAPSVQYNNSTSRTLQAAMQNAPASSSSSDLPASAVNLSKGTVPSSRNQVRKQPSFSRPDVLPSGRNTRAGEVVETTIPLIYPRAGLVMPVPVRAQRPPPKPAVHANLSASIARPSNPAPQIPSVVIPMSTQTLPRPPRTRIPAHLLPKSMNGRSNETLMSDGSGSTLPVSEFGMGGHRRESADDDTADGESQESSNASGTNAQRWEDFMASLERPHQTATLPRGASGDRMNGNTRRDAVAAARGQEERVERIAGMKREVDEKLQQIAAHSGNRFPAAQLQTKPLDLTRSRGSRTAVAEAQSSATGSRNKEATTRSVPNGEQGKKRTRKQSGRFSAMTSSEEESSSDEEEAVRSPKKRKKELDDTDDIDIDSATMVTESVEESKSSRPSRSATIRAKEKTATAVPAVTRSGTVRPVRAVAKKPAEPAVIPGVSTRTRGRRGAAS